MKKEVQTILNKRRITMKSPVGELELIEDGKGICKISFCFSDIVSEIPTEETPLLLETKRQLEEYFSGKRKKFEIPLSINGTDFQLQNWKALCEIPYGETRSYAQIAARIGSPKASRAVGMANRCNPVVILIPCHRVIGSDGKLVGYAGKNKALDVKEYLLRLEGVFS